MTDDSRTRTRQGPIGAALKRRQVFVEAIRSRLWPVPAAAVLVAVLAGIGIPELDAAIDDRLPPTVAGYLFGGGADAAREVLSAIAGSLITVTSLTFSLTLVTLQLASSQYSPRLLRTFAADRVVQRTLGLFLATFVYALTVLRTVRSGTDDTDDSAFVPQLAVTTAYLLAVASVIALVLFLGHLVRQIRVEAVLEQVRADTCETAARLLPPDRQDRPTLPVPPPAPHVVEADSSGFLVELDEYALLAAAEEAEAVVWVNRPVGSPVLAGTPVASWWSLRPQPLTEDQARRLCDRVRGALRTGSERTAVQDLGYGLRQLTDVVVRALSPGINDPTTAVHGLVSCTAVLGELLDLELGPYPLCDEHDRVRVVLARPTFAELLDLVCTQPRLYGADDPAVLDALLSMLRELAWKATTAEQRAAITDQLGRLREHIPGHGTATRGHFDELTRQVGDALEGRWQTS
ncbi:DUF2254 domain-containing protein [Rhodococcus ruber]|uniref:Predicted membrane protein n=1 Tax=Rhodococcus ruber TaxID=1830 RepID=A0A098BTP5_9NOCA|nr:DUF2254 domain-containing protein [Rhodococcus ruber]MBD8057000.1 DUF2254 domain-containing protein [Rhodococcus ruber]MBP2213497.1 putative membrane protein [Rhodococcus ruber]MCD2129358.1 DUF2254 domain-containing protein [Rhodococcus ruber]MCF8785472.1 DUF2254 domain-containing protein [Rhodococcus ruber]MCZ4505813.1 DUF2254 domain-containing protein [Rhodococcus ruber]